MALAKFAGVAVDRLRDIGRRHLIALELAERAALEPLAHDASITAMEMIAFIKWRPVVQLHAAAQADGVVFSELLIEARDLDRKGQL